MQSLVSRFLKDESGATAIEYALIALFIGVVLITVLTSIGTELKEPFIAVEAGFKIGNQ